MDNLNTHTKASLYEAFAPPEAKSIADKLAVHSTPKPGSWFNMAEITEKSLQEIITDRLKAVHVEITDMSGNVASSYSSSHFRRFT